MLFKGSCALLATAALVGDALANAPFERFAELSSRKGRRDVRLEKSKLNKRQSNSTSFRYLTNRTQREPFLTTFIF